MKIGVDITDPAEQVALLCKAIAHAGRSKGFEIRALLRLAYELADRNASDGLGALMGAATVAGFDMGTSREEMISTLTEGLDIMIEADNERPRAS